MIRQGLANNDGILEKKFKILRTSIMLGNLRNREATMNEYEETAREIDKIKKSVYEELLASKMYTTTSLEEEKERLENLIEFIEDRVKERNDFIDDYIKITSNFLDDLDKVSMENELPDYKIRLDNIEEYLSNVEKIKEINSELKKKRKELEEKYENKANNEIINSKLEDELIDEFNKIIARDEYYSSLNYTDIDEELDKIENSLNEKSDVMNTFVSSYEALKSAGISGAEREEYLSYVQDSRKDYYNELEKQFVLEIYKLVLDKENDYDRLYEKRLNIEKILDKRDKSRLELDIDTRDDIEYFANLCREQFSIIKSQKFNIESIDRLILEIANCEDKLEELEIANNRSEIVALLNEFSVEGPEIEKIELPEEKKIYQEVITKNVDGTPKPANMVVKIEEPVKINVRTASDTAKLVMKKVVIVLEPKKFNGKRDKLKEAEKELEERKRKEKLLEQEKKLEEEFRKQEEEKNRINEKVVEDNEIEIMEEGVVDVTTGDTTLEKNEELDNKEVIEIENTDSIGIKLDTQEVFGDRDVKETKELDEIKINIPDSNEISIPTEIFIEEPPKEELDLFSETDPFLDDNEYEIDNSIREDDMTTNLPSLKRIGSVKPNNMLSKIQDVAEENDDIILPTLGLTDNEKVDVPIVSENYIN